MLLKRVAVHAIHDVSASHNPNAADDMPWAEHPTKKVVDETLPNTNHEQLDPPNPKPMPQQPQPWPRLHLQGPGLGRLRYARRQQPVPHR